MNLRVPVAGVVVVIGILVGLRTTEPWIAAEDFAARRNQVREPEARLAQALSPWRRVPSLPAGGYDRLGPIYHVLAALTLVSWTGSPTLGALAADYEALRRIARVGRDRPDPAKARADRCGVEAGAEWLARTIHEGICSDVRYRTIGGRPPSGRLRAARSSSPHSMFNTVASLVTALARHWHGLERLATIPHE